MFKIFSINQKLQLITGKKDVLPLKLKKKKKCRQGNAEHTLKLIDGVLRREELNERILHSWI